MNPLQIEYFIQVANYKNFTLAASEMHVSQPAVSKQITALEEELGVSLFSRTGRNIALTPSGELFYNYFNQANTEFENVRRLARELDGKSPGEKLRVKLVFFIDWDSNLFMAPLVERLQVRYPLLEIDLENRGIYDIAPTLLDKRCDATICFDHLVPEQDRALLERCHLADVHRMAFYSVRHPFALRESVRFSDFKDEFCIALRSPKHPEPERTIRTICAQYGFEPKFRFKPNHDSVVMAVQGGRGYCVFDEWSRNRWNSRFQCIPLDFTRPVSIYWRKNNANPVIPVVVDALRELIQGI